MKNLNVALAEYLEDAPFAPEGGDAVKLKAIREGILAVSNDLPALIFEIVPSDYNEITGIYTDSVLVALVGKSGDSTVADLASKTLEYIRAMRGDDIKGLYISALTQPFNTKMDFDSANNQVQYLHTFEISWRC